MSHEHPSFRIQLGRRLEKVASEYFPSKTATAKVAGVSLEQFNKWIAGSVKVPIDAIYVLANTSDVDFSWLATGEGSISKESSPTPDHVMIQEIDVLAGCGGGGTASIEMHNGKQRDAVKKHWTIHKSLLDECKAKDARIVEVQGDSMTPTLHSGDRVIINMANRNPFPSGLFCIWDGLGCVVKRIENVHGCEIPTIRLISDNKQYQTYETSIEEAHIIGRVIQLIKRM